MPVVERVAPEQRARHAALFAGLPGMHSVAAAVLEGRSGELYVESLGARNGWMHLAPFFLLGGASSGESANKAVEVVSRLGGIVVAQSPWLELIERRCGDRTKRSRRAPFSAARLSIEHARRLSLPTDATVTVDPMDANAIAKATNRISSNLLFRASFPTVASFQAGGLGFCVMKDGWPVAAATSAIVSRYAIEVQVNTVANQRGRGFATLASAALVAECLERGITPHWDAANSVSKRLAERLGYVPLPTYAILKVAPPAGSRRVAGTGCQAGRT